MSETNKEQQTRRKHRHGFKHKYYRFKKNFVSKTANPRNRRGGMSKQRILTYIIALTAVMVVLTVAQTASRSIYDLVIPFTFVGVCAIGFVFGENAGAVAGILSGLLIDLIGSSGLSYTPTLFFICGFLCGRLVGWFLSYNLPSFIVYVIIGGVFKEIATFIYYSLFYSDHILVFEKVILPDYIACVIIAAPIYVIVKYVYKLFRRL